MLELVKMNYWWPEIKKDVKEYMQGYMKFQQNKVQHQWKLEELHLLEISQELCVTNFIQLVSPQPVD